MTITDPEQLRRELERVRERGWAYDAGELELLRGSIAAPIIDRTGRTVGAMGIFGSPQRLFTGAAAAARTARRTCVSTRARSPTSWGRSRGEPRRAGSQRRRSGGESDERSATSPAIDQGTASSRCLVFDHAGRIVSVAQKEHRHIYPRPGWVEHDPEEIWANVQQVVGAGARRRRPRAQGPRGARDRQPARDHDRVGARHRAPGAPRDQLAGHAHRRAAAPARREPGRRAHARAAPACRWPATSPARSCAGCSTTSPGCASAPSAGELLFGTMDSLADLEADRPAPDRRHQRQPHAADEPGDARLGRRADRADRRAAGDAAARSGPRPRSTARRAASSRACRSPPRSATSRRRCSARPASTPATPSAPTAPAASCCSTPARDPVRLEQRAADDGLLPGRRRAARPTRSRARSRSPARSCSGCATTSS